MYKLVIFVPEAALALVKNAVFDAGAGKFGRYDKCCWQQVGKGQYRPLEGSHPAQGVVGELTVVDECRLEMVCVDESIEAVVAALRRAHPYEEPAFDVWRLADF